MKRLLWLLPVLFVAALSAAPSIPQQGTAALSKFLTDATARGDVPGVVVTVVNKDGVLYHEAFGKSSTLRNTPMAKDTMFNIASMTKAVTSVAIMMLIDEGKLKLDDDVAKYLPKYKDPVVISKFNPADGSYETRPAKRPITIRHLLTHTSGIGYGFASQTVATVTQKTGKTELDMPLLFDPGESWAYGASTRVLGHVVEAISGQKIDAFLDSRILKPLGMQDTSYLVPQSKYPRVVAVNARGADGKFVERPAAGHDPGARCRAMAASTPPPRDYGVFLRMLLNGGKLGAGAHPQREVGRRRCSRTTPARSSCRRSSRRIWRCRGTSRSAPARITGGSASSWRRRSSRTCARPAAARGRASSTRISSSTRAARSASS